MKALAIILIGTSIIWTGCACDCADGAVHSANGPVSQDNKAPHNDGTALQEFGTIQDTSTTPKRSNTATDSIKGNTTGSGRNTTSTDPNFNKKTQDDPREYGTSSGGVGYRSDTIDAYKGIDGSARDKAHGGKAPNP